MWLPVKTCQSKGEYALKTSLPVTVVRTRLDKSSPWIYHRTAGRGEARGRPPDHLEGDPPPPSPNNPQPMSHPPHLSVKGEAQVLAGEVEEEVREGS